MTNLYDAVVHKLSLEPGQHNALQSCDEVEASPSNGLKHSTPAILTATAELPRLLHDLSPRGLLKRSGEPNSRPVLFYEHHPLLSPGIRVLLKYLPLVIRFHARKGKRCFQRLCNSVPFGLVQGSARMHPTAPHPGVPCFQDAAYWQQSRLSRALLAEHAVARGLTCLPRYVLSKRCGILRRLLIACIDMAMVLRGSGVERAARRIL